MVGFETITVEDATEAIIDYRGKTPPKTASGVQLITAKVIKGGRILEEPKEFIAADFYDEWMRRGLPQRLDVLITTEAPLGEVAILRDRERIALAQRVILLRARRGRVDPVFLFYALQSEFGQSELHARATGTTVAGIKQSELRQARLPVFELPVQCRIAGILSAYDELMENCQRRIRISEDMARALYREWFVCFRFPGHANAPLVDSPLGPIPQGWSFRAIRDFGSVVTGKTPSKANPEFYGEGVPFVKTPDMHGNMFVLATSDGLSSAGAQSQSNKTIPAGSICVSCIGTIGVVCLTTEDCQTNQQINSVVLNDDDAREFLFLRLQDAKQAFENLGASGATMGNVNKGKFEAVEFLTPTKDLLRSYHRLAAPMFAQILALSRKIQNLRRTRDLLLPRLLSGQAAP